MHFEQYYDKIVNVLKNHYLLVPQQNNADVILFKKREFYSNFSHKY